MNFNIGDKVWFIKHYFPKYPNRPFDTYKICKGVLKDIIPNVKIISYCGTVTDIITHYVIKGLPNCIFENVYSTEFEALEVFNQLKKEYNIKEYYQ